LNLDLCQYKGEQYNIMEKSIRDAGGCEDFIAIIIYENEETQIPSTYKFEYVLLGEKIEDSFDNVNPDQVNEDLNEEPAVVPEEVIETEEENAFDEACELSKIDINGNGTVTIAEAEAAGYNMPIYSTDWLYKYMIDRDGDGQVGE